MTDSCVSARDYYGDRLASHFKHSAAVARRRGLDPSGIIDSPELGLLLQQMVVGSPESADRIAAGIEHWFLDAHADKAGPGYWPDLIRYEGALFRSDLVARIERPVVAADVPGSRPIRRAASARIITLDHDLPSLIVRLDHLDESDPIPWAVPAKPTRLLIAMSPHGVLKVVRASDALEGFLKTVDGVRDFDQVVAASGMDREAAQAALRSLIEIGAVEE